MSISRKDFLRRGVLAFGRDILGSVTDSFSEGEQTVLLEEKEHLLIDNGRCLAQRGGCFACIDNCPKEAVKIALGKGIEIDELLCDGCGECEAVCPISPKVIRMKPQGKDVNHA